MPTSTRLIPTPRRDGESMMQRGGFGRPYRHLPSFQKGTKMQNYGSTPNRKMDPIVAFFADTKEDKHASQKEGRPIFRDEEYVKITYPADRQRTYVARAHASAMVTDDRGRRTRKVGGREVSYAEMYSEQYRAFKANEAPTVRGTPLSEAPFLTEGKRRSLRALQVYTVEQLAAVDPTKLGMGGMEMAEQAKAYLAKAEGSADVTRLAAENAAMKAELERVRAEQRRAPNDADGLEAMTEDELKDLIKDKTGVRPHGNTTKANLIVMAKDS